MVNHTAFGSYNVGKIEDKKHDICASDTINGSVNKNERTLPLSKKAARDYCNLKSTSTCCTLNRVA